jgi:hypothetical protein
MQQKPLKFEVAFQSKKVTIEEVHMGKDVFFRGAFENGTQIFLTRMKNSEGEYSWTSIPAGRQKEADEIGKLIEAQIIANNL